MRTSQAGRTTRKNKNTAPRTVTLMLAGLAAVASTVAATGSGGSSPVVMPPLPGTATFIDWDLPTLVETGPNAAPCPSALGAITRRPIDAPQAPIDPLYYVTLCAGTDPQSRSGPSFMELRTEMHPSPAVWRSWNLGESPAPALTDPLLIEPVGMTGGVRLSTSNRAYVRTQSEILRLEFPSTTALNAPASITRWQDVDLNDVGAQSDLAVVDRNGYTDVWSTHNSQMLRPAIPGDLDLPPSLPTPAIANLSMPPGMVQRMTVSNNSKYATVTRYATDGGAGLHYLSGVVSYQGKIYYSEGDPLTIADPTTPTVRRGNSIAVLDPASGDVHRFSLSDIGDPGVSGPRQLSVDAATGTIWAVTQSGHLVSLKPNTTCGYGLPNSAQMAAIRIPGAITDPRALSAAGGTIGFTQTGLGSPVDGDKVGLLVPTKQTTKVTASQETVRKETFSLKGTPDSVIPQNGLVQGMVTPNLPTVPQLPNPDGKFTQAQITPDGTLPLGILRDPFTCSKGFYLAVELGPTFHRISRVEFDTDPAPLAVPGLPLAPADVKPGLVTGGGTMGTDPTAVDYGDLISDPDSWAPGGGQSNFSFVVSRDQTGAAPRGNITYLNKFTGDKVKSLVITHFSVSDNSATYGGTCTNEKLPLLPCSFEVTIQDGGTQGRTGDTFNLSGIGFTPNQGPLTGGNVYIHRHR